MHLVHLGVRLLIYELVCILFQLLLLYLCNLQNIINFFKSIWNTLFVLYLSYSIRAAGLRNKDIWLIGFRIFYIVKHLISPIFLLVDYFLQLILLVFKICLVFTVFSMNALVFIMHGTFAQNNHFLIIFRNISVFLKYLL